MLEISILFLLGAGFAIIAALLGVSVLNSRYASCSYVISFALGMFIYQCAMLVTARWQIEVIVESKVRALIHILMESFCMPIIFFYTGYRVNLNCFTYNKIQMVNLGISANLVHVVLFTFLLDKSHMYKELPVSCLLFICTLSMAYTSNHSVELLKNCTVYTKYIKHILEGEAFLSVVMSVLLLHFSNASNAFKPVTTDQILAHTGLLIKACIIGLAAGVLVYPVIAHNDGIALTCFALGSLFCSCYFSMILLGHAIEVTPLLVGITLNKIKQSSEKNNEVFMDDFCLWLFNVAECIVFMVSGIVSALRGLNIYYDAIKGFLMYVCSTLLRGVIWFGWHFLGNFLFGNSLPSRFAFICSFAAYKSSPPLLLAHDNLIDIESTNSECGIKTTIAFFVCYHCLISSALVPLLCKILALTDFSKQSLRRINDLLKRILNQRQKTIEMLQGDIATANANWQMVEHLTNIYKPKTGTSTTAQHDLQRRRLFLKDFTNLVSAVANFFKERSEESYDEKKKELFTQKQFSDDLLANKYDKDTDIINSISNNIFELETNSYNRQYSEEIISKKTHLYLTNKSAATSLEKTWKRKRNSTCFYSLLAKLQKLTKNIRSKTLRKPVNTFRSDFFNLITSSSYKLFLTTIIILDSLSQLVLVFIYCTQETNAFSSALLFSTFKENLTPTNNNSSFKFQEKNNTSEKNNFANYLQTADHFCYGLFLGEFVFQIFGWGCVQHFQQNVWFVEFFISIVIRSLEQLILFTEINSEDILQVDRVIMILKSTFIFRFIVLEQYFNKSFLDYINNFLETLKNRLLMKRYERKYGAAIGHNDILQHYGYVFRSSQTSANLKKQWLKVRRRNKINMAFLAQTNNELTVAMKSKEVAMNVLKDSERYIQELKLTGHVYEFETRILKQNFKIIKSKLKNIIQIPPPQPKHLLQQVYWLRGDRSCRDYLLSHAEIVSFKAKERIIDFGQEKSSLFIIISGVCRYFYKPTMESVHKWLMFGILPNSDYFLHLHLREDQQDLIEPGNLIGEFGFASGRPYNVRVTCENNVTAIRIPHIHLVKLFHKCHFGNIRLAKLWKTIGIRFCIRHFLPYFKTVTKESLVSHLHNSIVPFLENVKSVHLSDDISEVLLIEGTVKDSFTRHLLTAPQLIKAKGQKLIINYKNIANDIPTRLMFIPKPGADILEVVKSYEIFKNYIKYSRLTPKLFGEDLSLKGTRKFKILRQFLKKHKKYMVIDFMLQTNDPKIGIPCFISSEKEKIIKRKKRSVTQRLRK